jgi:hypothetical protein
MGHAHQLNRRKQDDNNSLEMLLLFVGFDLGKHCCFIKTTHAWKIVRTANSVRAGVSARHSAMQFEAFTVH